MERGSTAAEDETTQEETTDQFHWGFYFDQTSGLSS